MRFPQQLMARGAWSRVFPRAAFAHLRAPSHASLQQTARGFSVASSLSSFETGSTSAQLGDLKISSLPKFKQLQPPPAKIGSSSSVSSSLISFASSASLSSVLFVVDDSSSTSDPASKPPIVGLLTHSDVLKAASQSPSPPVSSVMTPLSTMCYLRPSDSLSLALDIFTLRPSLTSLPVISTDNQVLCLISPVDVLAGLLPTHTTECSKSMYLNSLCGRRGLPNNNNRVFVPEVPIFPTVASATSNAAPVGSKYLSVAVGSFLLPHPFKKADGSVAGNLRLHGANEYSTDPLLAEDSFFVVQEEGGTLVVGVADGVGSWRLRGVDPRNFSRALMEQCGNKVREVLKPTEVRQSEQKKKGAEKKSKTKATAVDTPTSNVSNFSPVIDCSAVLHGALTSVVNSGVIGSCTACLLSVSRGESVLRYANVGDSGLLVLRGKPSPTVVFATNQQVRSFNFPYQLGNAGKEGNGEAQANPQAFEGVNDADIGAVPLLEGDVVVVATDGLFDNVPFEDVEIAVSKWEQMGGRQDKRGAEMLAKKLAEDARQKSLRKDVDSPFARLAKDNDVMWSGGMPDDTTIVVLVVEKGQNTLV